MHSILVIIFNQNKPFMKQFFFLLQLITLCMVFSNCNNNSNKTAANISTESQKNKITTDTLTPPIQQKTLFFTLDNNKDQVITDLKELRDMVTDLKTKWKNNDEFISRTGRPRPLSFPDTSNQLLAFDINIEELIQITKYASEHPELKKVAGVLCYNKESGSKSISIALVGIDEKNKPIGVAHEKWPALAKPGLPVSYYFIKDAELVNETILTIK